MMTSSFIVVTSRNFRCQLLHYVFAVAVVTAVAATGAKLRVERTICLLDADLRLIVGDNPKGKCVQETNCAEARGNSTTCAYCSSPFFTFHVCCSSDNKDHQCQYDQPSGCNNADFYSGQTDVEYEGDCGGCGATFYVQNGQCTGIMAASGDVCGT